MKQTSAVDGARSSYMGESRVSCYLHVALANFFRHRRDA